MKVITIVFGCLLVMGGCASQGGVYKGSGANKLKDSPCAKCNKLPFYVDTQFKDGN